MNLTQVNSSKNIHRFLDESGDTTFFGNGKDKQLIMGNPGVSLSFAIGMLKISEDLNHLRKRVIQLQEQITQDSYLNRICSVAKKIKRRGFIFHAKDDPPEVRHIFYKFISGLDCSLEAIVARKIPSLFAKKHNHCEAEFYADILSHLLKNKFRMGQQIVLNIAHRANSTKDKNLELALNKATDRACKKWPKEKLQSRFVFNVTNPYQEPLLSIVDYLCWAVQRVFEKGDVFYYDFIRSKISLVVDIYDFSNYKKGKNFYTIKNPLTLKNKLGPLSA